MRLEFTDVKGVSGSVIGDTWEMDYDGSFAVVVSELVDIYEEVSGSEPVPTDDLSDIGANVHRQADMPVGPRLNMLRRDLLMKWYIAEAEVIDGSGS